VCGRDALADYVDLRSIGIEGDSMAEPVFRRIGVKPERELWNERLSEEREEFSLIGFVTDFDCTSSKRFGLDRVSAKRQFLISS